MSKTQGTAYLVLENSARQPKRPAFLKVLGLLSLLALTLVVTNLVPFPVPWSPFRVQVSSKLLPNEPAAEWRDDTYPLREQTPWDISTDFPYPRKLEYDVTEGTWLRLDVHPQSGDIVFDMIGGIYCIPGSEVTNGGVTSARPVLRGIPHDADPHFSPTGDRIVFRSDAELGIDNIWVMKWQGCEAMSLQDLPQKHFEYGIGEKETPARRMVRLFGEGRGTAQRVTNETYRTVSDARFHPSGSKVIATKWYTSSRSLGAGEGWEYLVPSVEDLDRSLHEVSVGAGERRLSRTLPPGWSPEQYGDQQIGTEQILWAGEDSLIFSKNVADQSAFTYSKDVHKGIYAIFQTNLTTKTTSQLVDSSPGGASRPELSRDGRTLAFVRRVRDKQALVFKDLVTGSIHNIWYGLTYDLTSVSAPMGTYPSFAFAPSDDAVIIWAAGQIWRIPLATNAQGEKVASSEAPHPIRFKAHVVKHLAETLRGGKTDLVDLETRNEERVRAFRNLRVDEKGDRVVFEAAGVTYLHNVQQKTTTPVPVSDKAAPYYSPSFVPGYDDLVLHARWSNTNFTTFELSDITSGRHFVLSGPALGRYFSAVISDGKGRDRHIAFLKSAGDLLTGDVLATANPGLYIGRITLPDLAENLSSTIPIVGIQFIESEIDTSEGRPSVRFLNGGKTLLVQQTARAFTIDISSGPNEHGKYPHRTIAEGKMSQEIAVVAKSSEDGGYVADQIGFVDAFQVYLAPGSAVTDGTPVWSKPGNASEGLARLSLDGGHDLAWSMDGKKLFWFLGPYLHFIETSTIPRCSAAIRNDQRNFGISCVKDLLSYQEVIVKQPTHIAQAFQGLGKEPTEGIFVVYNATLITMATRKLESDLLKERVLHIRGGVIHSISSVNDVHLNDLRAQGTVVDAAGGYLIPGLVDVHAHWSGFETKFPAKSWEMETFLAYGVTTLHNPSADTVDSFTERSRVEAGFMVGPRIFSTGIPVYSAADSVAYQDVTDMDETRSALVRIKVEGGEYAISYKNYNIPFRGARQRLLLAARNFSMLCVPEGGMNYDWDITYIIDGMTTVEHALPVPVLYDDVLTLYSMSGTGSTPTHLVNYGGAWGEQFVWANEDVPNDPKLRRFTRHDILERLSESYARPKNSYAFFNTSESVANMVHQGLLANIGAHGEPPLGVNYHAEMEFTRAGGLTRYETLRAATIDGATTLGLHKSIGSLEQGKLADFILYPPNVDILKEEKNGGKFSTVGPTRDIFLVGRAGRVWKAETMEEIWPAQSPRQVMPVLNAD